MPLPVVAGPFSIEIAKSLGKWAGSWATGRVLDAMLEPGLGFNDPNPAVPIASKTTSELVNGLTINIDLTNEQLNGGQSAINQIASRENGAEVFKAFADDVAQSFSQALQDQLQMLSPAQKEQFNIMGVPDNLDLKVMDKGAAKGVRAATRASKDRYFVSKEFHEWIYCRDNAKVDQIFDIISATKAHNGTYGTWVDAPLMRAAIQKVRGIRRISHGDKSTQYTELLGTTRDALFDQLANASPEIILVWVNAVDEWNALAP